MLVFGLSGCATPTLIKDTRYGNRTATDFVSEVKKLKGASKTSIYIDKRNQKTLAYSVSLESIFRKEGFLILATPTTQSLRINAIVDDIDSDVFRTTYDINNATLSRLYVRTPSGELYPGSPWVQQGDF